MTDNAEWRHATWTSPAGDESGDERGILKARGPSGLTVSWIIANVSERAGKAQR
jgi:hypothetical protein